MTIYSFFWINEYVFEIQAEYAEFNVNGINDTRQLYTEPQETIVASGEHAREM